MSTSTSTSTSTTALTSISTITKIDATINDTFNTDFNDAKCKIYPHINREISGQEFNELFPNIEFVKLTNEHEKHNDHQYCDGLNVDEHEFNHTKDCSKGGFYFTMNYYIHRWLHYLNNIGVMHYMRKVIVPDDAKVYIEDFDKFKVNKFILGPKERINTYTYMYYIINICGSIDSLEKILISIKNKELYLKVVEFNAYLLKYIPLELRDAEICAKALGQTNVSVQQTEAYEQTKIYF